MLDEEQAVLPDPRPSPTSKPPTTTIALSSKNASAGLVSSTRPSKLRDPDEVTEDTGR